MKSKIKKKRHRHEWRAYWNPNGSLCKCGKRKNASGKVY